MSVKSGDTLYAYIYLDPNNPPQEVMLQWNDGDWNQRAYWGQNLINWGTDGTNSRRYMGSLPATGGWVRLEVPAAQVGLEGVTVNGMAFVLYGGRAWWDRAGVRRAIHAVTKYYDFNGQRVAMRRDGLLTYLHTDHLGSVVQRTNSSGAILGNHVYQGYGSRRGGDELATDHRFTGQKLDGTGLQYFNARYYDPVIGQFISPDTIVPRPVGTRTNLFDYNRYMYVRGRVLNMNDPSGHDPWWINGRASSYYPTVDERDLVADYYNGNQGVIRPTDIGPIGEDDAAPWGPSQSPNDNWVDLGFDWLLQHGPAERVFVEETHMVELFKNHHGVNAAREAWAKGEYDVANGHQHDFGEAGYIQAWTELDGLAHFIGSYNVRINDNGNGTVTFTVRNTTGRQSFTNLRSGPGISAEQLINEGRWGEVFSSPRQWRWGLQNRERADAQWGGQL